MTSTTTLRCDQCGKVTDYTQDGVKGWLRILDKVHYTLYPRPAKRQRDIEADLCSWQCIRDYAVVQ